MKSNVICGLKGEYRVDIFSGDTFIRSTDWFSNDITNTGMLYPFVYPFARCFMFLSLGSGQITSTGPGGISGLQNETGFNITNGGTPIMGYQTLTAIQSGNYMGWKNYRTGNKSTTACGTQFTRNGLSFFRGWQVPSGGEAVGGNGLNISSFMVSPSSGSDPTGKYAFSMINQNVSIPSGYNATIFYRLSLNFPDYINQYNLFTGGILGQNGYFDTSNATVGGLDTTLINGWNNLSGMYRQLFPGLQCVDNLGGCVVPPNYGAML